MCKIDWKSFSELREVEYDISNLGYKKEYIEKRRLKEKKRSRWENMTTGIINFFEPLEVKAEKGEAFWRYNENHIHMDIPEEFETQFGKFQNHNHGEFVSWLEKKNYADSPKKKKGYKGSRPGDFFIEGYYSDMFDCGEYTYAVSNLMHMWMGLFKIIRIDKNLNTEILYENYQKNEQTRLEYIGRFANAEGYVVAASGIREVERQKDRRRFKDVTVLFQIDRNGNLVKSKEWEIMLSSVNSIVTVGDYAYFGQNKMVTRLNLLTGEANFFTNKTDEELEALAE